jgi:tetratricopeptide (TPR) repeat protein
LEKKVHRLDLAPDIKVGDFLNYEGNYWIVAELDCEFFRGNGVLLSDDVPIPRLIELGNEWPFEDETEEDLEWSNKGIFIFSALLKHDPHHKGYKYNLAKALFANAIHMKRFKHTRLKAKELFEEVLALSSKKAHCHYYIAFIDYFESDWQKAIDHFETALELGQLDYFQQLRAYCHLALSYSQLDQFEQAKKFLDMAREKDVQNRAAPEIRMAELQIKPFLLLMKGKTAVRISNEEADEIVDQHVENGYDVLDFRTHEAIFCGPNSSKNMTGYVELLRLLMNSDTPLSRTEICEKFNDPVTGDPTTTTKNIGVNIQRLRDYLKPCYDDQLESVIQTDKNGYQWCSPNPYQIIIPYHRPLTS